jgi:WD40 repeat protein
MAATSLGEDVLLWRLQGGRTVGAPRRYTRSFGTATMSLSPDGRTFVVVGAAGVEVVDVATLRSREFPPGDEKVVFLARFTPDGRYVVGGSVDGWTRLWSTKTWRPVSPRLGGHTGEVLDESVSPDGRTLATGSMDGSVRLYDMRTWRPVGAALPALPNRAAVPRFTPDGRYLLVLTDAGRGYRWDVRPASLARRACSVAGRTLTRPEWAAALPGREYAPACAA